MELALYLGQMTPQFGFGMQALVMHWVSLSKGMLALCILLQFRQMEITLCRVQQAEPSGCGIW